MITFEAGAGASFDIDELGLEQAEDEPWVNARAYIRNCADEYEAGLSEAGLEE